MFLQNIKHLLINISHEGCRETLRRLCFRFFRINSFYIYSLNFPHKGLPVSELSGITVEEIKRNDLHSLRAQHKNLASEFYIDKLDAQKKQRSFVCFVNEFPALIIWLCAESSSGFLIIGHDEVEMNHMYCLRRFRGRKLLQHTICTVALQMWKEGIKKIITVVHSDNIASIKSIERCGFKREGSLKRLGILSWKAQ